MPVSRTAAIAVTAAAFASASPAYATAQNLIVDGDFETINPVVGAKEYYEREQMGAWTILGYQGGEGGAGRSNVVLIGEKYLTEAPLSFKSASNGGIYSLDLTGAGNTGPQTGISQKVATVAGQAYSISFLLGNMAGNEQGSTGGYSPYYNYPSSIDLYINGMKVASPTVTNANAVANSITWQSFSYNFNATGAETEIKFLNATEGGDNFAGLDNVSMVAAVPEPGEWAMMIGGLAVVGGVVKRRRRAAASQAA